MHTLLRMIHYTTLQIERAVGKGFRFQRASVPSSTQVILAVIPVIVDTVTDNSHCCNSCIETVLTGFEIVLRLVIMTLQATIAYC
jgi:hypothetical protein